MASLPMSRFTVRKTFIEMPDEPSAEAVMCQGRRRASSDAAVCYEPAASDVDTSDAGGTDPILGGLSDTDTSPEADACAAPLPSGGLGPEGPTSSAASGCSPPGSDCAEPPAPSWGGAAQQEAPGHGAAVSDLLSENARLALENQLLRRNTELAAQNAALKASRATQPELDGPHAAAAWQLPACYLAPAHAAILVAPWTDQRTWSICADEQAYTWSSQQTPRRRTARHSKTVAPEARTTAMLRNLPNNYTRAMVMKMLSKEGFAGKYDFLYLPMDFRTGACLGYAFVNLVSPGFAPAFWRTFDGYSRWTLPSKKVCGVTWGGPHQGLEAHVERYRDSPVMHPSVPEEYRPVILRGGQRIPFPAPTMPPRAPRVRDAK